MKILVKQPRQLGFRHFEKGTVIEVPDDEAMSLLEQDPSGYERVSQEKPAPKKPASEEEKDK
jgi:hypothetical protein